MTYFVKFLPEELADRYADHSNSSIKLGTFKHYREIENAVRVDVEEGQRGLDLLIKKPSKALDELIAKNPQAPPYPKDAISSDGEFTFEYHVLDHEHLYDFNSWMFCCSIIEDLSEIKNLSQRFNTSFYYFISDVNEFIRRIQIALANDLRLKPKNKAGNQRIPHPKFGNVFLDVRKGRVNYSNDSKYTSIKVNTLEEFYETHARRISFDYWHQKSVASAVDKEFRIIFFPVERRGGPIYKTMDDFVILPVNLKDVISGEPKLVS